MREIKFRAWDKKEERIKKVNVIDWETKEIVFNDDEARFFKEVFLMQFTGLKDKNGKEIYEGDIIKVEALVVYKRDGWDSKTGEYFGKIPHEQKINELKTVEWRTDGFNLIHSNWVDWNFEVIGNIYENPELVEGEGKNEKNKG